MLPLTRNYNALLKNDIHIKTVNRNNNYMLFYIILRSNVSLNAYFDIYTVIFGLLT